MHANKESKNMQRKKKDYKDYFTYHGFTHSTYKQAMLVNICIHVIKVAKVVPTKLRQNQRHDKIDWRYPSNNLAIATTVMPRG